MTVNILFLIKLLPALFGILYRSIVEVMKKFDGPMESAAQCSDG
jgi:hypothetical protein